MPVLNNAEYLLSNASASTNAFQLRGGCYGVDCTATFGGGSVTLQKLAGDGSTWITCLTAFTAAGYATVNLPRGDYRISIATATAVYCKVSPIANIDI